MGSHGWVALMRRWFQKKTLQTAFDTVHLYRWPKVNESHSILGEWCYIVAEFRTER
jgi:hypothetical protein